MTGERSQDLQPTDHREVSASENPVCQSPNTLVDLQSLPQVASLALVFEGQSRSLFFQEPRQPALQDPCQADR